MKAPKVETLGQFLLPFSPEFAAAEALAASWEASFVRSVRVRRAAVREIKRLFRGAIRPRKVSV